MTKNEIKARLNLIFSLRNAAFQVGKEIVNSLENDNSDGLYDIMNEVFEGIYDSPEAVIGELKDCGYLNSVTEEGPEQEVPDFDIRFPYYYSITSPCNGGKMEAYVNEADFNTRQTGVMWKGKDVDLDLDLCCCEVKQGDLAKKPDNKDIDIYVYGDPYTEDWTENVTIKYEDIENVLKEE